MLALLLLFIPLTMIFITGWILNTKALRQKRRAERMRELSDRQFLRAHITRRLYATHPGRARI